MADPLADLSDLQLRDLATDPDVQTAAEQFLASASAAIREAAGVPISRQTYTITTPGTSGQWLNVPGRPVVSVEDVTLDGDEVNDFKLVGGRLWRPHGWHVFTWRWPEPANVGMTVTSGLETIPGDIVELVCQMVGSALNKLEEGYAAAGNEASEAIDDYRVNYITNNAARLASVMELPPLTQQRLATRFGGGAGVVETGAGV